MSTADYDVDYLLEELSELEDPDEALDEIAPETSTTTSDDVNDIIEKTIAFMHELIGFELFPYQIEAAWRMIESVVINDGEEISILISRQAGKSETVADVVATLMILLPKLAPVFPDLLGKFERGFWVGLFAPTEDQADTLFSRVVSRLTSERAVEIMLDPEIDDRATAGSKIISLKKSGSLCRMQTANPKAKIESKSYHLLIVDECQHVDPFVISKSIGPMGAFYNATRVVLGTPERHKGYFYRAIQLNKRRQTKRGARQNHFEYDWRVCAKYNPNYAKYVRKEILRLGEDSDEFQLAYALRWLLDRGMFITSSVMDQLADKSMDTVRAFHRDPILIGVDPARTIDSTVLTAVWVDWNRPDEYGYYYHRVLNWLEIHGDDWEKQYGQMVDFCSNYNVWAVAVDGQGVGDAVGNRLEYLLPYAEVHVMGSTRPEQSIRWKHLMELTARGMVSWPGSAKARRLKVWKRFYQQMVDLEKRYEGPHLLAEAPREPEAHDDYPDSLALACSLTRDLTMPEVEVSTAPFYEHRSR